MRKEDIYKNVNLFAPHSFEYIHMLLNQLKYTSKEYDKKSVREDAIDALKLLFEIEILSIYQWVNNSELNKTKLSKLEILSKIESLWLTRSRQDDFYDIVIFGSQEWYIEELKDLGLTHTTDWKWFVENKIGNLEDWIKKNRP